MWLQIIYRHFWDVPRLFTVRYKDQTYLFDSKFDEEQDEYSDTYKVYRLEGDGSKSQDWEAEVINHAPDGQVKIDDVQFDHSRRQEIHSDVFLRLAL